MLCISSQGMTFILSSHHFLAQYVFVKMLLTDEYENLVPGYYGEFDNAGAIMSVYES